MRNSEIIEAKPAKTVLRKRIDAWINALSVAEAAAKQVGQGNEKHLPGYFLTLGAELDGLHVTHASRDNRAAVGTTDLQS